MVFMYLYYTRLIVSNFTASCYHQETVIDTDEDQYAWKSNHKYQLLGTLRNTTYLCHHYW